MRRRAALGVVRFVSDDSLSGVLSGSEAAHVCAWRLREPAKDHALSNFA